MTGATVALSVTVVSVPPAVFLTVKALLPREAAARFSSKVMTRDMPFAAADANAGAVVSVAGVLLVTGWSVKVAVALAAASTSLLAVPVEGLV